MNFSIFVTRQQMEIRAEKDHGKTSQCKVAASFCCIVHSREHLSSLANKYFSSVYYIYLYILRTWDDKSLI